MDAPCVRAPRASATIRAGAVGSDVGRNSADGDDGGGDGSGDGRAARAAVGSVQKKQVHSAAAKSSIRPAHECSRQCVAANASASQRVSQPRHMYSDWTVICMAADSY